jgi:hypothetical protein
MDRWYIPLVFCLLVWGGLSGPVHAVGDPFERASLIGITTLQVVVEDLNPLIVGDGLDRAQIKETVSQRLEQAGIIVEEQAENALYIHLDAVKNDAGFYSYSSSLQLLQMVLLFRDPGIVTWGTTWSSHNTGAIAPDQVHELELEVQRGVQMFLIDYRAANSVLWEESSYWPE